MGEKEELFDAWQGLYATVPPLLGEDEKTVPMIAADLGIDYTTARRFIEQWVKDGKIECVGMRRIRARANSMAYKVIT